MSIPILPPVLIWIQPYGPVVLPNVYQTYYSCNFKQLKSQVRLPMYYAGGHLFTPKLHSFTSIAEYERQINAYKYPRTALVLRNVQGNFGQSRMITCDHMFTIGIVVVQGGRRQSDQDRV